MQYMITTMRACALAVGLVSVSAQATQPISPERFPPVASCHNKAKLNQFTYFGEGKLCNLDSVFGRQRRYGWYPVHFAAYYGSVDVIKAIIKLDTAKQYIDKPLGYDESHGYSVYTPVVLAKLKSTEDHAKIVRLLVAAGARPFAPPSVSDLYCHNKAKLNQVEYFVEGKLCTSLGSVYSRQQYGWHPVHFAAYYGSVDVIKAIVKLDTARQYIDKPIPELAINDGDKYTPVALAQLSDTEDHAEVVRLLVAAGARPFVFDLTHLLKGCDTVKSGYCLYSDTMVKSVKRTRPAWLAGLMFLEDEFHVNEEIESVRLGGGYQAYAAFKCIGSTECNDPHPLSPAGDPISGHGIPFDFAVHCSTGYLQRDGKDIERVAAGASVVFDYDDFKDSLTSGRERAGPSRQFGCHAGSSSPFMLQVVTIRNLDFVP